MIKNVFVPKEYTYLTSTFVKDITNKNIFSVNNKKASISSPFVEIIYFSCKLRLKFCGQKYTKENVTSY